MSTTTTIYAKNKDLNTSPIRSLMRNGENNADKVNIVLPRFYGEYDLSKFEFIIEGINSNNTISVQNLPSEINEQIVTLSWTISESFTAVSGGLKLKLKATKTSDGIVIVFDGGEIEVCGENTDDYLDTSTGENLLAQIETAITNFSSEFSAQVEGIAEEKLNQAVQEKFNNDFVTSSDILRIVKISQEKYDALEEKSETTLYVIV